MTLLISKTNKTCMFLENQEESKKSKLAFNKEKENIVLPKLPVWTDGNCYSFIDWVTMNQTDIDNICEKFITIIHYLNNRNLEYDNSFMITYNEKTLRQLIEKHLYKTSINVKKNYRSLK